MLIWSRACALAAATVSSAAAVMRNFILFDCPLGRWMNERVGFGWGTFNRPYVTGI